MSADWDEYSTGQLFDLINGYAFKSADFKSSGVPIIKIKNVKAGEFVAENFDYVDHSFLESKPDKQVKPGDLLITMSGNRHDGSRETWVGKVAWFNKAERYLVNQRVGILRLKDSERFNARFLAYQLSSDAFQNHFISVATSSGGQANLSPSQITGMPLKVPSKAIQDRISVILGELEDKIDLNRRINQTLEAMAQAIFKSWFVDCDSVKAKIAAKEEGRDPLRAAMSAISGKSDAELDALPREQYNPLAATAALFPDEMEESELGEIPRGWSVSALGEECAYLNRGISPKYIEEGGVLVLNQKCIRDFSLDPSKGRRHDPAQRSVSGRLLQVGDVLVNSTGVGTLGRVAQVLRLDEPTIVDSHVTVVRSGSHLNSAFLGQWFAIRQPDIEAMGEGSTGQTELSRGKLANMCMLVPDGSVLGAFETAVAPLKSLISSRDRESLVLQETRDGLLPRLLSGELSSLAVLEGAEA